jgi:hypothetical protein
MNGKLKIYWIALLFICLVSSACESTMPIPQPAYTAHPVRSLTPTNTRRPTAIPRASYTIGPTKTPTLTHTPRPTSTATATIKPGVLECTIITDKHDSGITKLQWMEYTQSVIGKEIYFSGEVYEVYAGDRVGLISINAPCNFLFLNIPHDIATGLIKGQHLSGYGVISDILYENYMLIYVNVYQDSLTMR